MADLGRILMIAGLTVAVIGLVLWMGFAPKWLGRLPGDIRIEREHATFYFPIVTCILASIILTVMMSLFRR
jgi:hypothetical protein